MYYEQVISEMRYEARKANLTKQYDYQGILVSPRLAIGLPRLGSGIR